VLYKLENIVNRNKIIYIKKLCESKIYFNHLFFKRKHSLSSQTSQFTNLISGFIIYMEVGEVMKLLQWLLILTPMN